MSVYINAMHVFHNNNAMIQCLFAKGAVLVDIILITGTVLLYQYCLENQLALE